MKEMSRVKNNCSQSWLSPRIDVLSPVKIANQQLLQETPFGDKVGIMLLLKENSQWVAM